MLGTDPSEPEEIKPLDPEMAATLMLWRTYSKKELETKLGLARDLRAKLLELAPPRDVFEQRLTGAILTGKGTRKLGRHPAQMLAERVAEDPHGINIYEVGDLAASWVLYAALHWDNLAMLTLAQLLFNLATYAGSKGGRDAKVNRANLREMTKLDRLAASWIRDMSPSMPLLRQSNRQQLSKMLATTPAEAALLKEYPDLAEFEAVLLGLEKPEENISGDIGIPQIGKNGAWTVRLVQSISDEGREAAAVKLRYGKLTKPLPLMGALTDVPELVGELDRLFPWLRDANKMVGETLTAMRTGGRNWFQLPPMLLLGPAGSGKTAYATTLARLTGTASGVLMLGGSSDNRSLAGTSRGWSTSMPSFAVQLVARYDCANPLIIGDEIDKVATSRYNGNVQDTLLMMLEPTSARRFYDEALLAEVDLSFLSWVLTANSSDTINETLLSRMTVIEVDLPGPEHAPLLFNAMLTDVAAQFGLEAEMLPPLMDEIKDGLTQRIANGIHPLRRIKAAIRNVVAKELAQRNLH